MTTNITTYDFKKSGLGLTMALILCLGTTGCTTDDTNSSLKYGLTAVAGVGCGLGAKLLGASTAVSIAAGAACAGAAYLLTDYLTADEKKSYDDKLNQSMKTAKKKQEATVNWTSPDGKKAVVTNISPTMTPASLQTKGIGKNLDQDKVKVLPANSVCRASTATFSNGDKKIEDKGVYCRDSNGDYVRVDGQSA